MNTPTPPASPDEADRPPDANNPRVPWRFGITKWALLCGCAADEHDNRVWCTAHAARLMDGRPAASNAVSNPPATLPWQDAAREVAVHALLPATDRAYPGFVIASAEDIIRRACELWARECDALRGLELRQLRAQLALCRAVIEEVRPIVKARLIDMDDLRAPLCDGSILDRIEQALKEGV